MRKKRQQEELAQQQQLQLQEPFYVRANASTFTSTMEIKTSPKDEVSSLGSGDRPNVTILAPISICLGAMLCYIVAGAFTLHKLDGWSFVGKFNSVGKNLINFLVSVVSLLDVNSDSFQYKHVLELCLKHLKKKLTRSCFLCLISD